MSNILNEKTFEDAIISSLCENGGYILGDAKSFDKDLAFDKETILKFLYDTQKESWEKLEKYHGDEIRNKLTARIYKELDLRGMLDVLRNGIVDYGVRFNMCYFKPENAKNPNLIELYDKNILTVTRQVYYSLKNSNSLDLLLSVNGMPVATMELKNHFTSQSVKNAKKQPAVIVPACPAGPILHKSALVPFIKSVYSCHAGNCHIFSPLISDAFCNFCDNF